jgi:hypothetical protein
VPDAEHDAKFIKEGFMYPDIGWVVNFMPGFIPKPEVTHINQLVPPPLRAWVTSGASNAEMVLDRKRKFVEPLSEDAVSISTNRYHDCLVLSRTLVDMRAHANCLNRKKSQAVDDSTLPSVEFNSSTKLFLQVIKDSSSNIDCAAKFQKDTVKWRLYSMNTI